MRRASLDRETGRPIVKVGAHRGRGRSRAMLAGMPAVIFALATLASGVFAALMTRPGLWRVVWCVPILCAAGSLVLSGGFIAKKALALLCMPTGLLWIAGYLGLLLLLIRRAHGIASVVAVLWVLFTLAGNLWIGGALLNRLERPFRVDPTLDAPLQVLVVLGGGTSLRPDGAVQAGPAGDRLVRAARLYHAGKTKRLLASGTSVAGIHQPVARDLGEEARTLWRTMGVPDSAILTLPGPRNTGEEMQAAKALIAARGWTHVGVLTSAWHLRRTLMQARRVGLDPVPFGSDFRGGPAVPSLMGLVPSGNGVYRLRLALWEYLGAMVIR